MSCFICWLREWQELVGAILAAIAVASTVWWTLLSEKRRRKKEELALRTALGAEVRHLAKRALSGHRELANALYAANVVHTQAPIATSETTSITVQHAAGIIRLPERTIYSNTAGDIGVLGEYARRVVHFYGQLSLLEQVMRLSEEGAAPDERARQLSYNQVQVLAAALLNAANAAADALPAFAETSWAEKDALYLQGVVEARGAFEKFKPARQDIN
jgi:hypothetical protein